MVFFAIACSRFAFQRRFISSGLGTEPRLKCFGLFKAYSKSLKIFFGIFKQKYPLKRLGSKLVLLTSSKYMQFQNACSTKLHVRGSIQQDNLLVREIFLFFENHGNRTKKSYLQDQKCPISMILCPIPMIFKKRKISLTRKVSYCMDPPQFQSII